MNIKGFKSVLAVTVATTMVFSSGIVAFADGDTDTGHATGTGIFEYDNSEAVAYDKIDVPTISTSTAFGFQLDPTGLLNKYEPTDFSSEYSVYFKTESKAKIKAKDEGYALVASEYYVITQDGRDLEDDPWVASGIWKDGSVTVSVKSGETPAALAYNSSSNGQLFIWMPDDSTAAKANYTAGLPGKMVELSNDYLAAYFEPVDESSATAGFKLKEDYLIQESVSGTVTKWPIDGRLYRKQYVDMTVDSDGYFVDSAADPISQYITLTAEGALDSVTNIGAKLNSDIATAPNKFTYVAPKESYVGYSDDIEVVNLSTKDKTVSAVVTLKNVEGLTFKTEDGYTTGTGSETVYDDKASLFVKVDDGTTGANATSKVLALTEDGKSATATYTATLGKKTGGDEITYRTSGTNAATGGHSYARFEGQGSEYSSNSFRIVATSNNNEAAKDAWNAWGKTITADTKPTFDIIYRVTDVADEAEEEEEVTPTAAYAKIELRGSNNYLLVSPTANYSGFEGLTAKTEITSFEAKYNNGEYVNVLDIAVVSSQLAGVKYNDLKSPLGFETLTTGDKITVKITISGTTYEATYTR